MMNQSFIKGYNQRAADKEIILRQYSRNLIFDALDDKKENGFYKGIKNEKF